MADPTKDKPADEAPVEVSAFKRSLYNSASPLPLQILRMSHTGRVLEDGITRGVGSLIGSVIGLPVNLYEFGKERWTGEKNATPKEERVLSSDWIEKKLDNQIDANNQFWTGRKAPEIRPGTSDGIVHAGGKIAPVVGSFFIPGAGQAQLANIGSKLGTIGKAVPLLGKLGVQLGLVDLGTFVVEEAEDLAGVQRPTAAADPKEIPVTAGKILVAAEGNPYLIAGATQTPDLSKMASALADKTKTATPAYGAHDKAVIQKVFDARYLADPAVAGAFDPVKVKSLQADLVATGHLKPTAHNPKPEDGIFGSNTVKALDASLRASLKPEAVTTEQKKIFEQQLRLLTIDLKDNPPSVHNFDSRVLSLQANAFALGLYDGKIDGLNGEKTGAILARGEPKAEPPKQVIKGAEMSPM